MTLREELIQYSREVIDQNYKKACKKHKLACKRFLHDIEREGTDDFPYIFDESKADRFLDWARLFKHTKGKLAGQYIEPDVIHKFIFGNIYGWVHKDTELRRFRKAYWQVGRKNSKSQWLAIVSSYECFAFGEDMAECYIGATKTEQAKIVWNEIKAQLARCDLLKGRFKVAYGKIEHIKSESFITALSKDAGKTGDGLNVQCSVIDEYHAHQTSEIYDVLISGMGARQQPLAVIITTAGFDLNHPCYAVEYKYVSQILDHNSPITNENYFVMINELDKDDEGNLIDDINDSEVWVKANPILCSYKEGIEYIAGEAKAALDVPEKMRNFLTKNMNVWINQREHGYMNMDKWAACKGEIPDLTGCSCWIGSDLSAEIDLASVNFEFELDDKYIILSHSFIPEETLEQKRKTDKVPYDLWVQQGWITIIPGAVIDLRVIKKYVIERVNENNWCVNELCFDKWNALQFGNEMMDEGYECVDIPQNIKNLTAPTKDFRAMAYSKKIIHEGNPVFDWAMSNAVVYMDDNENIRISKKKSTERIDPVAAALNSHARAMVKENKQSIYETEDIFVL